MKFENVKKEVRKPWTTAVAPSREYIEAAHTWCCYQQSYGRFYRHYTNTRWWFEHEQDALYFALKWGGR
jgi:hypothetical protein